MIVLQKTVLFGSIASFMRGAVAVVTASVVGIIQTGNAFAQSSSVPIVRDAEIEALVTDYAAPIIKTAGLGKQSIKIVLVNSPSFNAFVDGRRIFINTGALLEAETPNEIIGVLAHETGHLAGGHQFKLREQLAAAKTMAVVAGLLGIGAAIAGAASKQSGLAQAGGGIAMGAPEAAMRNLLNYQRTEEMAADRSAITYLANTGQSAKGMLTTFERFSNALSLTGTRVDPYRISHPMPRERIANLETLARGSPNFDKKDSPALQQRHDLMRGKIAAYTAGGARVLQTFRKDPTNIGARYGDAIATFLNGSTESALSKINALIKQQPKNPYFEEIRGEILLKQSKLDQAAKAFQRASDLDPRKSSLIRMNYGRTLMLTGKPDNLKIAVSELKASIGRDRESPTGYAYLAQAYGQLGDAARSDLASAEEKYYSGKIQDAQIFAIRAQRALQKGSPEWIQAQDIINAKRGKSK
ncbi:putative Zn-dependent protease [Phyllobacterium ifriqiyense]|uniref:Zn-dependent protease n=1 Tax=Phyllobacterium ifriqiyense TaxID=314238 RepID=A0ABU0SEE5_9HYPH|nr:M48 family metalloprotease [Phyllobacterium ifriqiyense]MDQ0998841.1 putative Zn-dependent protease [Phyllobacterium ifriqiyense]